MGVDWLQGLTIVDFVFMAILLLALSIGWARGLTEVLLGFVIYVVATIVAGRYSAHTVGWLNRSWAAQEKLADALERRIVLPAETYKIPMSGIPWEKAVEWLRDVPIPEAYKMALAQRIAEWSAEAGSQTAAEFIYQQLAAGVLHAVVFTVLSLVIAWILSFLGKFVSDQVKEIPLVGMLNRLLGGAVLVLQAAVLLSLMVGLLAPALSMYGMTSFGSAVEHAQLSPYFLTLFTWVRGWLFGGAGIFFFAL